MKHILRSGYAPYFLIGLLLHILCAWFSNGFYHVDEHFQILEFASYKMGNISASALPWEFHEQIRSSLLPTVVVGLSKVFKLLNLYNPFTVVFLLRLIAGLASWFITCRLCLLLLPTMKTPAGEKLFILMSMFLWFVPFLDVRFSSENISEITFLYGLYFILNSLEKNKKSELSFLLAGFLIGVSVFIRPQMAFALLGLLAWMVYIKKTGLKYYMLFFISLLIAVGLNVFVDYWFYGNVTFTPFNYFHANIIEHRAEGFGVSPFWFYFSEFLQKAAPPLSVFLLIFFFAGIYKNLKNPITWLIIPFILLHCLVGHKEMRFLFPVLFCFIYISALGLDYLLTNAFYLKMHRYFYIILCIVIVPLLLYITFAPAEASVNYCKFLYEQNPGKNQTLLMLQKPDDYSMFSSNSSFYRSPLLKIIIADSSSQVKAYKPENSTEHVYYLSRQNSDQPVNADSGRFTLVYTCYPAWILKLNVNNWVARTHIWRLFSVSKN